MRQSTEGNGGQKYNEKSIPDSLLVHVPGQPYGARLYWSRAGITRLVITRGGGKGGSQGGEEVVPRFASRAAESVLAYLQGGPDPFEVTVDPAALTPFQTRILEASRLIPRGKTATYGWVATAVGSAGAARAAGRALATNPLPIIYPCHRVIAIGCGLHGFSPIGGLKAKRSLLDLEGVAFTPNGLVAPCSVLS